MPLRLEDKLLFPGERQIAVVPQKEPLTCETPIRDPLIHKIDNRSPQFPPNERPPPPTHKQRTRLAGKVSEGAAVQIKTLNLCLFASLFSRRLRAGLRPPSRCRTAAPPNAPASSRSRTGRRAPSTATRSTTAPAR